MKALALAAAISVLAANGARADDVDSMFSFGMGLSEATVVDGGHTFRIYMHPHKDRFMLQPSVVSQFEIRD